MTSDNLLWSTDSEVCDLILVDISDLRQSRAEACKLLPTRILQGQEASTIAP
jgi:hypothetical protein